VSLILIYVVVFGALMIFMTTRGRRKQASQAQMMQSALAIGADVRTIGGLVGTIVDMTDEYIVVETTPGVKLKFTKQAIAGVVPPETPALGGYETDADPEAQVEDSDESSPFAEKSGDSPFDNASSPFEQSSGDEPKDAKDGQKV
jgi:preprotein translocase subunit YajC